MKNNNSGQFTNPRTRASHSLEETNIGWFPTAPVQKPVRGEWSELEDPWRNGSLLSELIAKLLLDEKNLVKEVDHFDKNGRLLLPPKLLLIGTELVVKSKAQAIHNIQLCLQALQKIPNFPKVEYLAEDLFESSRYMFELFQLIQSVFDIRSLNLRSGHPTHLQTRGRLLARRLPGRRSASAPPVLEEAIRQKLPSVASSATTIPPVLKPQPNEYYRKISSSGGGPSDSRRKEENNRKISPEPNVRRNIPRPSATVHPQQLISSSSHLKQLFSQIQHEPVVRSRQPSIQVQQQAPIRSSYRKPHRSRSLSPQLMRTGRHQRQTSPEQPPRQQQQRQSPLSHRLPSPHQQRAAVNSFLEDRHYSHYNYHNQNSSYLSAANLSWSHKPLAKSSSAKPSYDPATLHPQRYHSYSPAKPLKDYSDQLQKLTTTRQAAMTRERQLAQERDRRIRRRSFLDKYQQSEDLRRRLLSVNQSGVIHSSVESGEVTRARSRGRMRDAEEDHHHQPLPALPAPITSSDRRESNISSKPSVRSSLTNRTSGSRQTLAVTAAKDWLPPPLDPAEIDQAKAQTPVLPVITKAQQTAIRDWLLSHGISILDGEGGYYHSDDPRLEGNANLAPTSASVPLGLLPLPLAKDRLRNGETLCILFCYLEPTAAFHAHLFQLIHRSPRTIAAARANLDKVLWLFRVRRSPPLSMIYLCQPEEIIRCNQEVLWGLLWEIMQSYGSGSSGSSYGGAGAGAGVGYVSTTTFGNLHPQPVNTHYYRPAAGLTVTANSVTAAASHRPSATTTTTNTSNTATTTLSSQSAAIHSSRSYHYELPYSPLQRRSLDLSLLEWLDLTGILRLVLGNIARPPTVLALESYLKDGTLFCLLLEKTLGLPLPSGGYHKHPHSYSQCLANLRKCLTVLRGCKAMASRYLYHGVEEDLARGQWDCILGLLEDLHLFYDTIQQYLVFPVRRNSLPGAMGLEDHSKVVISSIPPIVSSWQQVGRPYLGLASIHRQGEKLRRNDTNNSHSFSAATTINRQNPAHPPSAAPAVFPNTTSSSFPQTATTTTEQQQQQQQRPDFINQSNQVRLDKYVPPPELSEEPRIVSASVARPHFQPRLDLRQTLPEEEEEEEEDNNNSEDENDVSFLFSPSSEEKRADGGSGGSVAGSNEEEEEKDRPDLLPSHTNTATVTTTTKNQQYPSVADMTAGDPAMTLLNSQSSPSPDIIPQSSSSLSRSPSPVKNRSRREHEKKEEEDSSILTGLTTILDWLIGLEILLPIPKHFYRVYTGNPLQDYSLENLIINASLLHDFGQWFSSGALLAQVVTRLTHLEITGVVKAPKSQAQRLNNIRKSLEMLALNNKKIPLRLLSCEEEVLRGDSVTVLQLLEAMKRAYHFVR